MIDLRLGDCLDILPTLATGSVDAVITDPPYPEIDREYGRMTEAEWFAMMRVLVPEVRRILKTTGSAVFILQPNSERVGRMRTWLWEFMAWVGKEWGIVQDAYWWNYTALSTGGATHFGLMRQSIKPCVWCGESTCYRKQENVLWEESDLVTTRRAAIRAGKMLHSKPSPSGHNVDNLRMWNAAERRGGVNPFNLIPMPTENAYTSAGAFGHGAGTPFDLADWWTRYICPPGGTVLDPFVGSGTMMLAAIEHGCNGIGIDKMPGYIAIAQRRIAAAQAQPRLELVVADEQPEQLALEAGTSLVYAAKDAT